MSERPSARKLPIDEVLAYCARRLAAGNTYLKSSQVASAFGVTAQLAAARLRRLEADGFLERYSDAGASVVWQMLPEQIAQWEDYHDVE